MNSCGLQDNSDFLVAILPLLYGLQGDSMIDIAANAGRNDSGQLPVRLAVSP